MSDVSTKFDRPHGRDWRSFLVKREFVDPLTMKAYNTMLNFRYCEFVIIPNSKVCRGRDTLAIGDDFGSRFLLGDRMHSPTCLGGIKTNASNMPKFHVHFGFLYNGDVGIIKTTRW